MLEIQNHDRAYSFPAFFIWENRLTKFYTRNTNTNIWRRFFRKPFHATGLFLYALKISEIQRFSDAFKGYLYIGGISFHRNRPVVWNGLFCWPSHPWLLKAVCYLNWYRTSIRNWSKYHFDEPFHLQIIWLNNLLELATTWRTLHVKDIYWWF